MRCANILLYGFIHFFTKKNLYKMTIKSYYHDYKRCYYEVKHKYRDLQPYMDIKEWEALPEETKMLLRENTVLQKKIVDEMVDFIKLYCKRFPDEKICQYSNFKTYDEFPYRLHQTVPEFMKML